MSKSALVNRIEALEAQLSDVIDGTPSSEAQDPLECSPNTHRDSLSSVSNPRLNGVVQFLALGHHDSSSEPAYLGPSSGFTIAESLGRMVHNSVSPNALPINADNQQAEPLWQSSIKQEIVAPPDDTIGSEILEAYFRNMHVRLPFLDRSEILDLHVKRSRLSGSNPGERFGRFKIFMVYAIGAAILQLTETYNSTPPRAFLITALVFDPTSRESLSVPSIEAMLLLVLYNLRSCSSLGVWHMIGLALRTCVDFGLHREVYYRKLKSYEVQPRRRLFWSVYLIERYIAWSLGRPFSITEEEIDAELPSELDDSVNNDDGVEQTLSTPDGEQVSHLRRFIASIRLKRITSQIHTRIYRVDKNVSALLPEVAPLMTLLEEYERSLPGLQLHKDDFINMHWNNSIRILLLPFLSILNPDDKLLDTCIRASGQMCQLFKSLRQRESSSYSFLLVNSIFMAGLTMWLVDHFCCWWYCSDFNYSFCLFRSPRLWTTGISNDLRACSSALFLTAERNPNLKQHRDGLEDIINKTMEFVNVSSNTNPGNQNDDRWSGHNLHGTSTQQHLENEIPLHWHTPTEPIQTNESQVRILDSDFSQGMGAGQVDLQMSSLFSASQGYQLEPQEVQLHGGELQGNHSALLSSFDSIFTDGLWDGDEFGLRMME